MGYNNVVSSTNTALQYRFNGKQYEEDLGVNTYDFGTRNYDPWIARWTTNDPVTHHSMSSYSAFDNNPVYWKDPSGADAESGSAFNSRFLNQNGGHWSDMFDNGGGKKEGQHRTKEVDHVNALDGMNGKNIVNEYYHSGGLQGSKAGWYSPEDYLKILKPVAVELAGNSPFTGSVEWFNNVDSTDDIASAIGIWASQMDKKVERNGMATPLYFTSPFFAPSVASKFLHNSKISNSAFWSGKGTQTKAISSGFKVLGQTRAGQNLANLTRNMEYSVGSQAWHFWGRLSQAYARSIPKGGQINVFLTKSNNANPMSIWNRFEKPILMQNKVKIKYNFLD